MSTTTAAQLELEQDKGHEEVVSITDSGIDEEIILEGPLPLPTKPTEYLVRSLSEGVASSTPLPTITTIYTADDLAAVAEQDSSPHDLSSEEDEVTSIRGTDIKDLHVPITAPVHLNQEETERFNELAKFCPTTLLNKDCTHYYRCALIQPCRKYSTKRWENFCHHGYRCHNSHRAPYTCKSVLKGVECVTEGCEYSHDKNVRLAIEAHRAGHEKGDYGVE